MLKNVKIGVAFTGSFCTYEKAFAQLERLKEEGADVSTIFSTASANTKNRFGTSKQFIERARKLTEKEPILTVEGAEPIGPKGLLDVLVLLPCTGNTLAKLANGITDTAALMAAKAQLRNERPVIIALSTNDALGMNLKNIGALLLAKNIYFIPFGQDDPAKKPNSMVAHMELLIPTIVAARDGRQYQPVVQSPFL